MGFITGIFLGSLFVAIMDHNRHKKKNVPLLTSGLNKLEKVVDDD